MEVPLEGTGQLRAALVLVCCLQAVRTCPSSARHAAHHGGQAGSCISCPSSSSRDNVLVPSTSGLHCCLSCQGQAGPCAL